MSCPVEFSHPFDFFKLDCVPVLEPVPDFVEGGDDSSAGLLGHSGDDGGDRLLAVDVEDDELLSKVGENLTAQTAGVGDDESNVVGP